MMHMDETIDRSVWLKPGEPKVNQYRLAKGDVFHDGEKYFIKYPLPLHFLYEQEVLDGAQYYAGLDITSIREAAYAFLDAQMRREAISTAGFGRCPLDPESLHKAIMARLKPYQRNIVARVCWEGINNTRHHETWWVMVMMEKLLRRVLYQKKPAPREHAWMAHCKGSVRESFDALALALDEMRKIMDDLKQSDGRGAPEITPPTD